MNAPDRRYEDLERRFENLQSEFVALRNLLEATATAEPVGLAAAARIAGVSDDTMYRHARRYGGWKVDPCKPKSQWRFDPERVRQTRDTAVTPPIGLEPRRRQGRSTVPLLPVKDRAA